jgi:hypothetical protein
MKTDLAAIRKFLEFVHGQYATAGNPDQALYHAARAALHHMEEEAGLGSPRKQTYEEALSQTR